jgi:hypothetical protein
MDDVLYRRDNQLVSCVHGNRHWLGWVMLIINGVNFGGGPMRFEGGASAAAINRGQSMGQTPAGYLNFNHGEATVASAAPAFGIPHGARHPATWMMGEVGGAVKSNRRTNIAINATATAEMGFPRSGSTTITINGTAAGGLIVGATGTATISIDGTAAIVASLNATGTATITIDGNAALGAIASITGETTLTINGSSTIMALGYMTGTTVETGELTPTGIATAVWRALAAQNNDDDTMGKLLNMAGTGGVDYDLLAAAIIAAAQTTPIASNVKKVNDATVTGTGISPTFDASGVMTDPGDPWRPV